MARAARNDIETWLRRAATWDRLLERPGEAAPDSRSAGAVVAGKQWLAYAVAVGDVFKALADPTRRALLDELLDRDGQTLFELCARLATRHGLGSTRQAVSQHLNVLEDAGLVTTGRQGRYKFHDIKTGPLENIAERWIEPRRREDS